MSRLDEFTPLSRLRQRYPYAAARACEMAEACDAAARAVIDAAGPSPTAAEYVQIGVLTGASAQAWAAVDRLLAPNGAKD